MADKYLLEIVRDEQVCAFLNDLLAEGVELVHPHSGLDRMPSIRGDSWKMYNVSIEQYIEILGEIHATPSGRRFVNYWLDMGHVGDFLATYVNMILVVSVYSQ